MNTDDRLPDHFVRALDDAVLDEPFQTAFLLVTNDDDGSPRIGIISAGELLVRGERTLRLALCPDTATVHNLGRGGAVLIGAISPGSATYVLAEPVRLAVPDTAGLECFELTVTEVRTGAHTGMLVTSGIMFRPEEPDRTAAAEGWRRQRELLSEASRFTLK